MVKSCFVYAYVMLRGSVCVCVCKFYNNRLTCFPPTDAFSCVLTLVYAHAPIFGPPNQKVTQCPIFHLRMSSLSVPPQRAARPSVCADVA